MRQSNAHRALSLAIALAASVSPGARGAEPRPAGIWRSCSDHFVPRAEPRIDVLRLGLACGPATGLTRFARLNGIVDESLAPAVLEWKAERKDCFRLFAVAGAPVDDLEVEIVGPHGARMNLTNQNRRWLIVGEDGPFCAPEAGEFQARFSTHGGRGALSAAVYRGARMLAPGVPWAGSGGAGSGGEGSASPNPY